MAAARIDHTSEDADRNNLVVRSNISGSRGRLTGGVAVAAMVLTGLTLLMINVHASLSNEHAIDQLRRAALIQERDLARERVASVINHAVAHAEKFGHSHQEALSTLAQQVLTTRYLFVIADDGRVVANPNLTEDPESNEGATMATRLLAAAREDPAGRYIDYRWHHHETGSMVDKTAWIQIEPHSGWLVGSGFHPADVERRLKPAILSLERNDKQLSLWILALFSVAGALFVAAVARLGNDHGQRMQHLATRLESSERRAAHLSRVVAHSRNAMVITSPHGRITWCNDGFADLTGFTNHEIIGRKTHELLQREGFDEVERQRLKAALNGGERVRQDHWCRRKDGQRIRVRFEAHAIHTDDGTLEGYLAHHVDITAEYHMAEQLTEALAAAKQAAEIKQAFLANMSHEIRTPMNGIMGLVEILLDGELDPGQRDALETVQRSSESLLTILNDILDVSRLEAGRLALESTVFDLRTLVYDVVDLFRPQVAGSGVELMVAIDDEVPQWVEGDPGRIRQVLNNLVGNAVKFTTAGHVVIGVRMSSAAQDPRLEILVADTGCGMTGEQLETVFDPFIQGDASTSRTHGGSGLGLAIVKGLVDLMGGSIDAVSRPGSGTTMSLELPITARATAPETVVIEGPDPLRGLQILVLDDDAVSGHMVAGQLQHAGAETTVFTEVEPALAALEQQPFDIAVIDRHLGTIDGHELARSISTASGPRPALILMTATGERGAIGRAQEVGINGYFVKPLNREILQQLVALACHHHANRIPEVVTRHMVDERLRRFQAEHDRKSLVRGKRILVAEDNAVGQRVMRSMLSGLGCEVLVVDHGQQAIEHVRSGERFDCILLDLQMPVMDGYATAKAIRAHEAANGEAPRRLVALTASVLPSDIASCLTAGMDDHLGKPVSQNALIQCLARQLVAAPLGDHV